MLYNKSGKQFVHRVSIDRDPTVDPTYTHKFPVIGRNGMVEERWSTKVRPIKSLTALLRGMTLKRNEDYMIEYNGMTEQYDYYFADLGHATWFTLVCGGMKQVVSQPGKQFNIVCPCCHKDFPTNQVTWI
jgi:hypothetical protein